MPGIGISIASGMSRLQEEEVVPVVSYFELNGGGIDDTDWINPTSGLADNWVFTPTSTYSIVTGDPDFTGNAQKCEYLAFPLLVLASETIIPGTVTSTPLSFKIKSNVAVEVMSELNGGLIDTIPSTGGIVQTIEMTWGAGTSSPAFLNFQTPIVGGAVPGSYYIIDEVNLVNPNG